MHYLVPLYLLVINSQSTQAVFNIFDPLGLRDKPIELPTMGTFYDCEGFSCKTCVDLALGTKRQNLCVKIMNTLTLGVAVSLNDKNLLSFVAPSIGDPVVCVPVPITFGLTSLCLQFYNVRLENGIYSGCISFELRTITLSTLLEHKLGCFQLGANGLKPFNETNAPELGRKRLQEHVVNDKLKVNLLK